MDFFFFDSLVGATKLHTSIDDEIYECIQEKDQSDTNAYFDLSVQLTEAELATTAPTVERIPPQTSNQAPEPQLVICNPVSIRPSQFPMNATNVINETTEQNETHTNQIMHESLKDFQMDVSKLNPDARQVDGSIIVIEEDTDEMSTACKSLSAINRSRRDTVNSPYKNHFATNPKLNETLNAAKYLDPFDPCVHSACLQDILFSDYIQSLENVQMFSTRVRPIEVNSIVEIGNETFHIVKQIGQGSFGFVFR